MSTVDNNHAGHFIWLKCAKAANTANMKTQKAMLTEPMSRFTAEQAFIFS